MSSRQEALLSAVPEIIMEVNNDKVYTWANPAGIEFFGGDVIGREAACYFEGEQEVYHEVKPIFKGEAHTIHVESLQRRRDGQKRLLAWRCRALRDERGNVAGALSSARDITDERRAEEALRTSQQLIESIINAIPVRVFWKDRNLVYLGCNTMFARDAGFDDPKDIIGKDDFQMVWRGQAELYRADDLQVIESGGSKLLIEEPQTTPEGDTIILLTSKLPLHNPRGEIIGVLGTYVDITGRKQAEAERAALETQLQQAQKMESVGRLAGGVAHDFNNMLAVILGYTEIALGKVDPAQPLHADLKEVRQAAERSADLTRQLLAFASKQTVMPRVLDLNDAVAGMLKMLQRLIGEDIQLKWYPGANLWPVWMDPSQADQILANLCVNARDAIADTGRITIETTNRACDAFYCAFHPDFVPGNYVLLVVSDNGCGMDRETTEKVFEPFFTTKEMGKGTGLGLATVYGIVKQNNGFINVYSEVGQGTVFTIYLPRHAGNAGQAETEIAVETLPRGRETVLVVEDEQTVLKLVAGMLRELGYTVLAAGSPEEAIHLAKGRNTEIALLMTDVIMPEMNGHDLANHLLSLYPHIKCLFMSGYTADVIARHGMLDEGIRFIQKPFSLNSLAAKVREVLESPDRLADDPEA